MPTIRFELTPEDWEAAQVAHLEASASAREQVRRRRRVTVAMFALSAVLVFLLWGIGALAPMALFFGLWMFGFERLIRFEHRRLARRVAKEGVAHGMFGPHEVTVSEEGLRNVTPYYEVLFRWPAVDRVLEANGNYLIYAGSHSVMIIPSTAFKDHAQLREFGEAFFGYAADASHLAESAEDPEGPTGARELVRRTPSR